MSLEHIEKIVKDHKVEWIDLRFVDLRGAQQHVTYPIDILEPSLFQDGKMFDGSSITGWKNIHESDMILLPDAETAYLDPFYADPTLNITCDIIDPTTKQSYQRDPRGIAKRAEAYLKTTGIADLAFFGPEPEFFIFDSVRFANTMGHVFYEIGSEEAAWTSGAKYDGANSGYRPAVKGGYFPVPPTDSLHELRAEMAKTLEQVGIVTELHHHEVATAGQCEIGTKFSTLVKKADELLTTKYIIKNVAFRNGKTATFMPKPIVGDNGSGMHVHQSLAKNGENIFSGNGYGGLSDIALWYIGGIFKHARAINAFANASTNSYKRLVPGFEAPVMLAYSARNRSASCRIPWVNSAKARRVEFRFPDSSQSGYLTFTALMMAGLDGIKNKIHPGEPSEKDLYDLSPEDEKRIPTVAVELDQALQALDKDRQFLKEGGVMCDDFIDGYIALKMKEVSQYRAATHPLEYQMYFGI